MSDEAIQAMKEYGWEIITHQQSGYPRPDPGRRQNDRTRLRASGGPGEGRPTRRLTRTTEPQAITAALRQCVFSLIKYRHFFPRGAGQEIQMKQQIVQHHWTEKRWDDNGQQFDAPAGGVVYGPGLCISFQNGPLGRGEQRQNRTDVSLRH